MRKIKGWRDSLTKTNMHIKATWKHTFCKLIENMNLKRKFEEGSGGPKGLQNNIGSCHSSWLPIRTREQDFIDQNSIHFGCKMQRNQTGTEVRPKNWFSARGCYAYTARQKLWKPYLIVSSANYNTILSQKMYPWYNNGLNIIWIAERTCTWY